MLEDALFHGQQAAEKAMKGFLLWHDRPFARTHSPEALGEQGLEIDEPSVRSSTGRYR